MCDCQAWLQQAFLADLPRDRRLSYFCFAFSLSVALATFQFIGPVKVALFFNVVGPEQEPIAKSLVLVVLIPILVLYSILVTAMPSSRALVVVVCTLYTVVYLFISVAVLYGNGNPAPWVVWVLYYATETRGVIIMPMIWSVVADVSTSEYSKKAYPFLFFWIQLGGIVGSVCAIKVSSLGGEVGLLLLQTVSFAVIAAFNWIACGLLADSSSDERLQLDTGRLALAETPALTGREDAEQPAPAPAVPPPPTSPPSSNSWTCCGLGQVVARPLPAARTVQRGVNSEIGGSSTGPTQYGTEVVKQQEAVVEPSTKSMLDVATETFYAGTVGLWLLLTRPYAMMTFWVSYAYLVPRTVLDYENSVLTKYEFATRELQVAYFGRMNLIINVLVAAISLFATRELVRFCGVGRILLILPVTMLICIGMVCIHYQLLFTTAAVIFASVISYGLNQPCKEMLYVRTSTDIKFKAKSWSEMYGNQLMKMLGAQVNLWVNNDQVSCRPNCFHPFPTMSIVLGWVVVWWVVAEKAGSTYTKLDSEDKIVS